MCLKHTNPSRYTDSTPSKINTKHSGRHQFPLRVMIPGSAPSSFDSQFGAIRYSVRVILLTNSEQVGHSLTPTNNYNLRQPPPKSFHSWLSLLLILTTFRHQLCNQSTTKTKSISLSVHSHLGLSSSRFHCQGLVTVWARFVISPCFTH